MKGVTKRQQEILGYLKEFIKTNRYSPSFREIKQYFGFSSLGTVYRHLKVLERKGFINQEKSCSRSIILAKESPTNQVKAEVEIPFIGQIAAGLPIETFTQARTLSVPEFMVHAPAKTYVLRAKDDSLAEEMIADGDFLIVEARQEAHAGETVVALINHHDTIIKKFYPEGQYVRLMGCHAHHLPIILRTDDILIQGVLVGLLRIYG